MCKELLSTFKTVHDQTGMMTFFDPFSFGFISEQIENIAVNGNDLCMLFRKGQNKILGHYCLRTKRYKSFTLPRYLNKQKIIQIQTSNNILFICGDKCLVKIDYKHKRLGSTICNKLYNDCHYTCFAANEEYMFFVTKKNCGKEEIWYSNIGGTSMGNISESIKEPQTSIKNLTMCDDKILYGASDEFVHSFCPQTKKYKLEKNISSQVNKWFPYRKNELLLVFEKSIVLLDLAGKKKNKILDLSKYCANSILRNVVMDPTNGRIIFNVGSRIVISTPSFKKKRIKILPFRQIIDGDDVSGGNYYTEEPRFYKL